MTQNLGLYYFLSHIKWEVLIFYGKLTFNDLYAYFTYIYRSLNFSCSTTGNIWWIL